MIFNIKRGMPYSPVTAVSDRFLRLLKFCRERGIRLAVSGLLGWAAFQDEDGTRYVLVQPREIEVDSEMGFLLFTHEVGHTLFGIPRRFVERTRGWFNRGTPLGLVTVILDEFAAWAAGFFLLRFLGIPVPGSYIPVAKFDLRAYFSVWRRRRAARGIWYQD